MIKGLSSLCEFFLPEVAQFQHHEKLTCCGCRVNFSRPVIFAMPAENQMLTAALAYSNLKDAEDVVPLNSTDAECLQELKEVLARHQRLDRFGICLLHKHFDMAHDEMLVESTDVDNRRLVMEVRKRSAAKTEHFIETQWKLNADGPLMGCKVACVKAGGSPSHFRQHVYTAPPKE